MNWDMKSYFPSFGGEEHQGFYQRLEGETEALKAQIAGLAPLGAENADPWEQALLTYEGLAARLSHLSSYVTCMASCDAKNEAYQRERARLSGLYADFKKLDVEILRGLKDGEAALFQAFSERPALKGAEYYLGRLREDARLSMSPELEGLAAELGKDGISAWGRLYDSVAGNLRFEMPQEDGSTRSLPMAQRHALLSSHDRAVRKTAQDQGNVAWEGVESTVAAALNHIGGIRHTLNGRRGVGHFLDVARFQGAVSERTLGAMFEAIAARRELPRSYLRRVAKIQGTPGIGWCDLLAPLALPSDGPLTWEQGKTMVQEAFDRAYPKLGGYFRDLISNKWVEHEPRERKLPGAYCTHSELINETRVYMTFQGSTQDVFTLAHEAGHAFHAHTMADMRVLSRQYPMTLAETASTFAELLLADGLLSDPNISAAKKALLLSESLNDGAIFMLNIPTRYEFERKFYEERAKGEVSVSRLKELMASTQREIYGDVLMEGQEDPYYWASKLHFYITGVTFYNYPYTFGYLLSRGLYASYKAQGQSFLPKYEAFLRNTGSAMAHEVAAETLGANLEEPEFWAQSIDGLRPNLTKLDALLPGLFPEVTFE